MTIYIKFIQEKGRLTKFNARESKFRSDIKYLISNLYNTLTLRKHIELTTLMFDRINDDIEYLLRINPIKWIDFACSVYNKTSEFETLLKTNFYEEIDKKLYEIHIETYREFRRFMIDYFKNKKLNNSYIIELERSTKNSTGNIIKTLTNIENNI